MVGNRFMTLMVNVALVFLLSNKSVHGQTCPVELEFTSSDGLGPFFIANSPVRDRIAPEDQLAKPSNVLVVEGHVYGNDCVPMAGAILEPWYAGEPDENGDQYSAVNSDLDYRGQIETDGCGFYSYVQTYPVIYTARPIRHVHYRVSHQERQLLVTQMYFEGDIPASYSPDISQIVPVEMEGDGSRRVVFDIFVNTPGTSTEDCVGSKSPAYSGTTSMSPSATTSDRLPTLTPSLLPTKFTSAAPSMQPTYVTSAAPSLTPADDGTDSPSKPPFSDTPTDILSMTPSGDVLDAPSMTPAAAPADGPSMPTSFPTSEEVSSAPSRWSEALSYCILLTGLLVHLG